MASYTSEELFEGVARHDSDVLQHIYVEYFRNLKSYVSQNKGSVEDTRDLFQETVVAIFQRVSQESFTVECSFSTYFFATARILWLKELHSRKQLPSQSFSETKIELTATEENDLTNSIDAMLQHNLYQKHFMKLSGRCQILLQLYIEQVSLAEIAEMMGVTEKFVKKKKFECKEKLLKRIQNDPLYNSLKNEI